MTFCGVLRRVVWLLRCVCQLSHDVWYALVVVYCVCDSCRMYIVVGCLMVNVYCV